MSQETQKERLIRIMGTFDLATGHADTFDELLDSLETELRDVLGHYRAAVKEHLTQEPVAMLERDPSIGRLRITYEDAVTELDEGVYPLYVKPHDKPAQRPWVNLTDREKSNLWLESRAAIPRFHTYASLVEAKLKEKNT